MCAIADDYPAPRPAKRVSQLGKIMEWGVLLGGLSLELLDSEAVESAAWNFRTERRIGCASNAALRRNNRHECPNFI